MKRIIYIPFDHLHRKFGALKEADPKTDVIAFVESARMTTGRNWHTERLFFLISSDLAFNITGSVCGKVVTSKVVAPVSAPVCVTVNSELVTSKRPTI